MYLIEENLSSSDQNYYNASSSYDKLVFSTAHAELPWLEDPWSKLLVGYQLTTGRLGSNPEA